MAIIKEMNCKFGLSLSYHRITAFNINYANKKAVICVASYLSKEARSNKNIPLEEIDIEIPYSDFPQFQNTCPISQGYLWLKKNVVGFEESIDDMEVVEKGNDPVETENPIED
ncbi:MAG: hypothetical protein ABH890_04390 [Bacillota bacterium]